MRVLTGLGLGAGLMYFLDPNAGRRRRARMRDQCFHMMREIEDGVGVVTRDLTNRGRGLAAEARSMFAEDHAPDATIEARVRSAMGRVVSHPRAIRVEAHDGRVSLSGPILAHEVEALIATARSVRGVRGVENRLEVHQEAGGYPALQGGTYRTGVRSALLQENWTPTTKLFVGLAGVMLGLKVMRRPGMTGLAIGALGAVLIASGLACSSSWAEQGGASRHRREPEESHAPEREMTWASP